MKARNIRSKIAAALVLTDSVKTAVELSKITGVKLSSLSSVLYRLVKRGSLVRVSRFGPRGGYGYRRRTVEDTIYGIMAERMAREIDEEILRDLLG